MKKLLIAYLIVILFNTNCSKIRNDTTMMLCTSLETNPNLCSKTISKNLWFIYSFYLLININPVITKKAAKIKSGVITSLKINHPKKIVNIGVKKEKLATPEAGYFDNNHNQNKKPPATTTIDWKSNPQMWIIWKSRIGFSINNEKQIKIGPETITIHNNCISGISLLKFEFFAIIISKAQNSAAKNAKKSPNKLEELIIRPLSFLETDITTPEKAKINPSSLIKESFSLFFVKKSKIVNQSGIE